MINRNGYIVCLFISDSFSLLKYFHFAKYRFFFQASGLNFLSEKNITRSTYICAHHWPGESSFIDEECVDEKCAVIDTHICINPSGKLVSDQGSQIIYSKYEFSAKVESMVLRNDIFTTAR